VRSRRINVSLILREHGGRPRPYPADVPNDSAFVRSRSFWLDSLVGDPLTARPSLPGDGDVDVAIVGAGFTGLWTAYYLLRSDPTLRVAVLEREVAGFGASGRNGGWCSALLPMSLGAIAADHGRDAAIAMQRAMHSTVGEVVATANCEGIECDAAAGGYLHAARAAPHLQRLHDDIAEARSWGFGEDDLRLLDADETGERIAIAGVLAATYTPHCAAINPAKLVRGLARTVERLGATIYESTAVSSIEPHLVRTEHGTLRAEVVVRATEGYTPELPDLRRAVVPIYSLMIATEPLPDEVWTAIGWQGRETLNDARRMIIYAQRTADGRIAFGGRGAPYHFASRVSPDFERDERVHRLIAATLAELFPAAAGARITHRWGGPLGAARDWHCSVGLDRSSGLAWAGGYVGDGVATSNLAGRTLADLVTERTTDLTRLPWVGHRSHRWEPEPLRWLAINATLKLPAGIDATEQRTGRPARARSWVLDRILGR
jgi:glycine/D-amino acid oxidase-like deaminating enzyme